MTTLVLGATGATGRLAVQQLLVNGESVKALVRSKDRLTSRVKDMAHLEVIESDITDLTIEQWQQHLQGVTSVISCLGHNLTFKGMYGHPRRLVTDALASIHQAIVRLAPSQPVKYILMNTTGARNPEMSERHTLGEKIVVGLLRHLLPPHADNEDAASYLRTQVGHTDPYLIWVVVRPDSLIDTPEVSRYSEEPSPVRSPIFDAGQTSRINVGNFMMRLVVEQDTWQQWQGKTPVLYNTI